jgi:hypothetical protein
MRTKEAFPSRYLSSADVKNGPIIDTISFVKIELVGQGQDQKNKPVLYLERNKPMVLNKTNFETLDDVFGDSDDWGGHRLKIKLERVQFQGKTMDGLRVDPIKGAPVAPSLAGAPASAPEEEPPPGEYPDMDDKIEL